MLIADYVVTARNCTEAGKSGCVVNLAKGELCGITIASNSICFCDANCNLGSEDCCGDAIGFFLPGKLYNFGELNCNVIILFT